MGLSIAIMVVISRFSISIPILGFTSIKVGLGFIVTFFVATEISPLSGAIVAAASDVIHAFLFPIGPYFVGFTITSFISGLIVGYLFKLLSHNKNNNSASFFTCLICVSVTKLFITIANTFWINILYSTPFSALIIPRLIAMVLMIIIITPICFVISKYSHNIIKIS